ncbi:hypothetical protein ACCO45_004680 [Purpureocillium lilacinum]|uniref:Uncharacterized protein n=1 Tax=Purpureocillium lilacinum TaxID=33203 RepID=A0ACC4DTX3_PURLI
MLFQRLIVYSIVSWYTNVGSMAMDCAEGTKLKGVCQPPDILHGSGTCKVYGPWPNGEYISLPCDLYKPCTEPGQDCYWYKGTVDVDCE